MKTILLTNRYSETPLDIIQSVVPDGFRLVMLDEVTQEDLIGKANLADYLLVSGRLKINNDLLSRMENLKMIQRTGVGLDSLDLDGIKARNIPLYVNQGVNANSVAEHTVLLMLAGLRRLTVIDAETKKGIWKKQIQGTRTHTLCGRKVGIIGMGHIGREVAKLLVPFGAEVMYFDQYRVDDATERALALRYVALPELFENAEIITLHCALTDETRYIINEHSLNRMVNGVILVNTARGQLICEENLIQAIYAGKVGFAALDVYENEPLIHSELTTLPNVITTPHIAGVTYDAFYQMMHDAMRNIKLFDEGRLQEIEPYRLRIGEQK